jgi:hypothetical protein
VCIDAVLNASPRTCEDVLQNVTRGCGAEAEDLARRCGSIGIGSFSPSSPVAYALFFGLFNLAGLMALVALVDLIREYQRKLDDPHVPEASEMSADDRAPALELEVTAVDTGPDTFADADASVVPDDDPRLFTIDGE